MWVKREYTAYGLATVNRAISHRSDSISPERIFSTGLTAYCASSTCRSDHRLLHGSLAELSQIPVTKRSDGIDDGQQALPQARESIGKNEAGRPRSDQELSNKSSRLLQRTETSMATPEEPSDFSLMLGGPLYQIWRRAFLSGPALELVQRRVLVISLVAWLPLAVLSAAEGHLFGTQSLTFIHDIELHVRFLVALPALILAELMVQHRLRPAVKLFVERGIIREEDRSKFNAAIERAMRARNSVSLELALLLLVYTIGIWIWRNEVALGTPTWYRVPDGGGMHLTLAGFWLSFVSLPIFQFILLRWYIRLVIWFLFLWRVSRLNLRLLPSHPDRAGGIGFLGGSSFAFSPILFAEGTLLAGFIANRIFYQGQSLLSFKWTIVGLIAFFVVVILGPLAMFTFHLSRTKRAGTREYGTLATAYVSDFDQKWIRGGGEGEAILGTADIQALADLGSTYRGVDEMRPVPFSLNDAIRLSCAAVIPILPLILTIMPLDELAARLFKLIF
jgi:hypothetical protein